MVNGLWGNNMGSFQRLLSDYQAYSQTCKQLFNAWMPASTKAVAVKTEQVTLDKQALQEALSKAGEVQGWLLLSSERLVLNNEIVPPTQYRVLAADLSSSTGSIRVRELSSNKWLLVRTQIEECDPEQATHLAISVDHIAASNGIKKLCYQQLWSYNSEGRLGVTDAVFTGFKGE